MKAKPILFSAPMVNALLQGKKTQTRRVINPQPQIKNNIFEWIELRGNNSWACLHSGGQVPDAMRYRSHYGVPGDLLWVRESFYISKPQFPDKGCGNVIDRDGNERLISWTATTNNEEIERLKSNGFKSIPSIHMPRWASRLTLEIIGVRVERLQDISAVDAAAEGCQEEDGEDVSWSIYNFHTLWASINGEDSWTANPWVWVLDFKVHKMNVDEFLKMVK